MKDSVQSLMASQQLAPLTASRPAGWRSERRAIANRFRSSSDGAGSTPSTATSLVVSSGSRTLRDTVSRRDLDFYSFTLNAVSTVKITLTNRSQIAIARTVFAPDGSILISRRARQQGDLAPRTALTSVYRSIRPGTYYLKLQGKSTGSSAYRLSLAVTIDPPEDCGCGV